MSDRIIILWGFIVVLLVCTVFVIGKYHDNNKDKEELEKLLQQKTNLYLSDYNKYPSVGEKEEITSNELIEKKYVEEINYLDKKCDALIIVENKQGEYKYSYDINCYEQ